MKKKKYFITGGVLSLLFLLFTAAVLFVDVRPIGPQQSSIGLAGLNNAVFRLFGVHLVWYHITDWLGVAAILVALGFAVLGFCQLVQRKSIQKVDGSILALGVFYGVVIACYGLFEVCVVNHRPIVMGSVLEASYPSSHTTVVVCIMATAMMQFHRRIRHKAGRWAVQAACAAVIGVTVVGRLISGVHWFTDIVGGLLLAAALCVLYYAVLQRITPE